MTKVNTPRTHQDIWGIIPSPEDREVTVVSDGLGHAGATLYDNPQFATALLEVRS